MGLHIQKIVKLLEQEFSTSEMDSLLDKFIKKTSFCSKWVLYSDYCLDDKNKPNDVISFVLVPYLSTQFYVEMDKSISETQPNDIKKSKSVDSAFIKYLKGQPILSFNFIVNERKFLFGDSHAERVGNVAKIIKEIKEQVETWRCRAIEESIVDYYDSIIKKLNKILMGLSQKANIKMHMEILLVTIIGAYYSAMILKRLPDIDLFGWLSDRDAIKASCDEMAAPIFHVLLYNHLNGRQFHLINMKSDTKIPLFYENYNRIPDVICGALADYNMENDVVSKDKFSKVLQDLIADNAMVKIYRLSVVEGVPHLGIIKISTSPFDGKPENKIL